MLLSKCLGFAPRSENFAMEPSDIKTTMQYVHTAEEQMLKAMALLNSYN